MVFRLRMFAFSVAALLVSSAGALAADCNIKEFSWAEGNWAGVCSWPSGVYDCTTQAQWNEAKKNIDWVLFEDRGALQTFKRAYKAADDCDGSLGGAGKQILMLRALLYAQRHNQSAQCSIELCRRDWWGFQGYYDKLKDEGRLPNVD